MGRIRTWLLRFFRLPSFGRLPVALLDLSRLLDLLPIPRKHLNQELWRLGIEFSFVMHDSSNQ
uniref:Uncharacterized protein n=1 Tax=Utricularia reniformis TaxID=192314 RepID=A0A1Y0B174_9LAMI|nr:hypothetical protein AEK19_MT0914 [Utricularia reniformis]ART31141.1 hypothetical protein AEK19_MT0914 [Utricularia reniformis]